MFDIAWSELLLIAVLALIFIGPKELPHVLNNLGRMTAKLRRSADEFRRHFEESMREAGYEDLHKNIQDFRALNPANQLKASIDRAIAEEYPSTTPHDSETGSTAAQGGISTEQAGPRAPAAEVGKAGDVAAALGNGAQSTPVPEGGLASGQSSDAVNGVAVPQPQVPVE